MAGYGTGYPIWFECAKARQIWYGSRRNDDERNDRTHRERAKHRVELTGRTRPTPRTGKGHPRKSWTTFEYKCSCGHVGWSSHKNLESRAERAGIAIPWRGPFGNKDER
jgi:hypothetical protein